MKVTSVQVQVGLSDEQLVVCMDCDFYESVQIPKNAPVAEIARRLRQLAHHIEMREHVETSVRAAS